MTRLESECQQLAQLGWRAYELLFTPDANNDAWTQEARRTRRWLEALVSQQRCASLEIQEDGAPFLPWSVVYDRDPAGFTPTFCLDVNRRIEDWQPFWGVRHVLGGGSRSDAATAPKLPTELAELVVVDRSTLPEERELSNCSRLVSTPENLSAQLKQRPLHLLYWFSHADPAALYLNRTRITPTALLNMLSSRNRSSEPRFAILNACRTAESSSGAEVFHLDALTKARFSGAILTEAPIPNTVAHRLGEQFRNRLKQGEPAAVILHDLRLQHENLPLSLLYTAACRPDLRICQPREGHIESLSVETHKDEPPPPAQPYRSLAYFDYEDRRLFTGREADAEHCAAMLTDPEVRIMLLHGNTGVGKSSFLRAGLVPYLEKSDAGFSFPIAEHSKEKTVERKRRPRFFIVGADLVSCLVEVLLSLKQVHSTIARPDVESEEQEPYEVEGIELLEPAALRKELLADPERFVEYLRELTDPLPESPILVLDQFEQVYTLAPSQAGKAQDHANEREKAFEMLRRAASVDGGSYKLILSLRTEYAAQVQAKFRATEDRSSSIETCLLDEFSEESLIAAIKKPTEFEFPLADGTLERFAFFPGMVESLAKKILERCRNKADSALPIAQLLCSRLYSQLPADGDRTIRILDEDLKKTVDHGLAVHVQDMLDGCPAAEANAVRELLVALYQRHTETTLATTLIRLDEARRIWAKAYRVSPDKKESVASFDVFLGRWEGIEKQTSSASVSDVKRYQLFRRVSHRVGGGESVNYLCLAHDALAVVAEKWADDKQEQNEKKKIRFITRIASAIAVLAILACISTGFALHWLSKSRENENNAKNEQQRADSEAKSARLNLSHRLVFSAQTFSLQKPNLATLLLLEGLNAKLKDDKEMDGQNFGVLMELIGTTNAIGLNGHVATVEHVAFSDDCRWLATASKDKTVRIWDLQQSEAPPHILHRDEEILHVTFSHDCQLLAASGGTTTTVWNLPKPEATPCILKHKAIVRYSAFSRDGQRLATISGEQHTESDSTDGGPIDYTNDMMQVWNLKHPDSTPRILCGHENTVAHFVFSSDGRWLATTGKDNTARVWDLQQSEPTPCILGMYTGRVTHISISPNGKWLAIASEERTKPRGNWMAPARNDMSAWVWDLHQSEPTPRIYRGLGDSVVRISFSPDARWLATANKDKTSRIWDLHQPKPTPHVLNGLVDSVHRLTFSPDARWLATHVDNAAQVWDLRYPETFPIILRGHDRRITSLAFSSDSNRLATASVDETAKVWNLRKPLDSSRFLRGHEDRVNHVAISLDGRWLATASSDKTARLWDLLKPETAPRVLRHDVKVTYVAISPDGQWLTTASDDKSARVWDLLKPEVAPRILLGHTDRVTHLAISPDGRWLTTASDDKSARVWDLLKPEVAPRIHLGHTDRVTHLAISPDGRWLTTASDDKSARVWDLLKPEVAPRIHLGHTDRVTHLAISPDGRWLATACEDKTVRVWDLLKPEATPYIFRGHTGRVTHVSFSPGGRWLATAGDDNTLRLWDALKPEISTPIIKKHDGRIIHIVFSSNNQWLATTSDYRTLQVWDLRRLNASPLMLRGDALMFSPDGQWLISSNDDNSVQIWSLDKELLIKQSQTFVGRNITWIEWQKFFPDQTYRRTFLKFPWPNDLPDEEKAKAETEEMRRLANHSSTNR